MGLSFRSTDIQTANIYFDLYRGYAEPAEVRGRDGYLVGVPGRFLRPRIEDRKILELRGYVKGSGATETLRQQSWRTSTDTLMALLDMTLAPGALVVSAPYLGLATGTKTISAQCINVVSGRVQHCMTFQLWTIELEAVGNPPDWA